MMMRIFDILIVGLMFLPQSFSGQDYTEEFEIKDSGPSFIIEIKAQAMANKHIRDKAYLKFTEHVNNAVQNCWLKLISDNAVTISVNKSQLVKLSKKPHKFRVSFNPANVTIENLNKSQFEDRCIN
jgi:hypothetical protein